MDRRMLVIAGIAAAALALPGCGDDNDPTDNAAQAAPKEVEVVNTPKNGSHGASDAAQNEGVNARGTDVAAPDQQASSLSQDKAAGYFNRSDASQP
jgi:hypothetical protein